MKYFQNILILLALIAVLISIEGYTDLDVMLSDYFYNFEKGKWFLSPQDHENLGVIFYSGAKKFVTTIGTCCVLYILCSIKVKKIRYNIAAVWVVLLSTILVPTVVSRLKTITNVHCPNRLEIYGGYAPYVKIMQKYPDNYSGKRNGRCFPGGHVTGTFSLLALSLLFLKRRNKIIAFLFAFTLGNIASVYQMMRGEHFISHNLTSFLIALIVINVLRLLVEKTILYFREFIKYKDCKITYWNGIDLLYIN